MILMFFFCFVFRLCGVYPLKEEGETSDCEGDIEGRRDGAKRMKIRDLESVLGVEGESACSGLSGLRFLDLGTNRLILHLRVVFRPANTKKKPVFLLGRLCIMRLPSVVVLDLSIISINYLILHLLS